MQHFGKRAIRAITEFTKGYSDTQLKVRDATSNEPWGPSDTQMNEIAEMTCNQDDYVEILEMLYKRLNEKGKNWRHVFKSLTLLDYLLHQGSENMIIYFRDNLYVIKTLEEFQYVDKDGKDQGGNVRAKARFISSLLQDEGLLLTERSELGSLRERIVKGAEESKASLLQEQLTAEEKDLAQVDESSGDDIEMPRAIETSKASLRQEHHVMAEEQDLAEAIELSEEESRRLKAAEESNTKALFDDQHQLWVLNSLHSV
ncbi:hypothetical protein B0H14DRAFT_2354334 [Mycena olivaceomarginata]|nr:hypothetical protein B0H14DRAFT_2354334 [Mycena olivaceomarginata]